MASFTLNTGQTRTLPGFQNRTSDVFASLGGLEQDYDAGVKNRGPDEFIDEDRNSPERDGEFKRPTPPRSHSSRSQRDHGERQSRDASHRHHRGVPRFPSQRDSRRGKRQWVPDHKLHPERWTAYSLEDTDVSGESTNKRAAVDFFRDLRERKAKESQGEKWDAELHCGKIAFKMPVDKAKEDSADERKGKSSYSNVHKMPEYVIGQGKAKGGIKKRSFEQASSSGASTSQVDISFGHLDNEEESDQSQQSTHRSSQSETLSKPIVFKSVQSGSSQDDVSKESSDGDQDQKVEVPKIAFIKKGKAKRKIRERKEDD